MWRRYRHSPSVGVVALPPTTRPCLGVVLAAVNRWRVSRPGRLPRPPSTSKPATPPERRLGLGDSPALRARRYELDVAAPQSALLPSPGDTGTTRGGCPTSYATAIAGATTGRAHGWTRRNRSGRGFNDRRFDQPSREARPLFPTTVIHVTPEPARSNLGSRKVGRSDGSAVRLVVEDDVEVEPGRDRVEALEVVLQESLALGSSRGSIERTFSRASLSVGFFSRSASLRVS